MSLRPLFAVLALLIALSLSAGAQSAARPRGVAGIAFGSAPDEVWKQLAARTGATLPEEMPAGEKFELTGGMFAGQEVQKWLFEFSEKKLSAGSVVIKPATNPMALYREIKQGLVEKYGPATGERKAGANPEKKEKKRDNEKETFGNVAYWKFSPTITDREAKVIVCEVAGPTGSEETDEARLQITLRYLDETLHPAHGRGGALPSAKSRGNAPVKGEDL